MEDFLVLGLVPNTTIQIDFIGWLVFVQVLLLIVLVVKLLTSKYLVLRPTEHVRRALQHYFTVRH